MTYNEYRQLRLFARYDGIYLGVLWTASFACLIGMTLYPELSMFSLLLALSTPMFVVIRLKKFRDEALEGIISFNRGLAYCLFLFLNASLLFAIVQWLYMHFLDQGHLAQLFRSMLSTEESRNMLKQIGTTSDSLTAQLSAITPMEFASTYFIENCILGILFSIPIAFFMQKRLPKEKKNNI
jgi:hypothetical protein